MLFKFVCIILGRSESKTGRNDALNSRIIGQVQEKRDSIQAAIRLEIFFEKSRGFHVHSHCSENNREIVLVSVMHVLCWPNQASLSYNLSSNLQRVPVIVAKNNAVNRRSIMIEPRYVANQPPRRSEFSDHEQSRSSCQWSKYRSGSSLQGRCESRD